MKQARRRGQNRVPLCGFFLVSHAKVATRSLQVQDIFIFNASRYLRSIVIKLKPGILLQDSPITLCLQFINDIIGWCSNNQRRFEFYIPARLFNVFQHLGNDLHIAFVDHAGANKSQINFFLSFVERDWSDCVMGISFGYIHVIHIRICNHRLINLIQIYDDFCKIFGIFIWGQSRFFARFNFTNSRISDIDQPTQRLAFIFHSLVNHNLNTVFRNLKRFYQGSTLRNADRCLRLHFSTPVCEGKGLIGH